jgi:hypothetical protein
MRTRRAEQPWPVMKIDLVIENVRWWTDPMRNL